MTNMKELPNLFVRQNWREMLDSMLKDGLDIMIRRYRKLIAFMIPERDYEVIEDLLDEVRKLRVIKSND